MYSIRTVADNTFWIGGSDRRLERFENLFTVPDGIAYNSYVIIDEKVVLLDTVDPSIQDQFLTNVDALLKDRSIDYLFITHVEPDHGGGVAEIIQRYPSIKLVGSKKAHQLFQQFFPALKDHTFIQVSEGDTLSLGKHELQFYSAPMVHWPEVMFVHDTTTGALFSSDAFGAFGALDGNIFVDEINKEKYIEEVRRYYSNIVGKFGPQVQSILKKLPIDKIKILCPLHGLIWRNDLDYVLGKYDLWSRYIPESQGIVIVYTSMYGHTASIVHALAQHLADRGVRNINMYDVAKTNPSYCIGDIWKYSNLVLAAPTYNMGLHYAMDAFLNELKAINTQNRKVSILANHSWASAAMRIMTEKVSSMKNMKIIGESLDILSNTGDSYQKELGALADAIVESMK